MKFFYIMLDLVFKRFYGQTYTLLTLMLCFGYHGYRAQFKNDMDGAGAPPSLSETVGHWAAGYRARLQYTRQKRGEMIAYQRRAALTEGMTLPEVCHEVETALRADTTDQAGGKTRIATSAVSPPVPSGANCESPIALAWESERQAGGGEPNLTLPAAGVPPARAPPPTGLIGTRVALTSLDASIPFANMMFARPGQPQHVGQIVAVISPGEEDRTGEYEVQAAFPSPNASQTQYVAFPASEVAAVAYVESTHAGQPVQTRCQSRPLQTKVCVMQSKRNSQAAGDSRNRAGIGENTASATWIRGSRAGSPAELLAQNHEAPTTRLSGFRGENRTEPGQNERGATTVTAEAPIGDH